MVFVIVAVKRLCQGISALKGGRRLEQLIIYMLIGRHRILYSAWCLNPVCVCVRACISMLVCTPFPVIKDECRRMEVGFFSFFFGLFFFLLQKRHVGSDSHLFRGKFSNCGNDVITLCHNRACVMRYLPCQAWILQMEIRVGNCH